MVPSRSKPIGSDEDTGWLQIDLAHQGNSGTLPKSRTEGYIMAQVQSQRLQRTIGALQIAIIVLIVITALVHLQRGIGMLAGGFGDGAPRGLPPGGGAGRPAGGPPGGFNIFQYLP